MCMLASCMTDSMLCFSKVSGAPMTLLLALDQGQGIVLYHYRLAMLNQHQGANPLPTTPQDSRMLHSSWEHQQQMTAMQSSYRVC